MSKTASGAALAIVLGAAAAATAAPIMVMRNAPRIDGGYSVGLKLGPTSANPNDFFVRNFTDFSNGGTYQSVYVPYFPGKIMTNGMVSSAFSLPMAKRLAPGDMVGPGTFGSSYFQPVLATQTFGEGEWFNGTNPVQGFLGLQYANGTDGQGNALINYAFINVMVTPLGNQAASVEVLGWGYETTPGVGIQVSQLPEPGLAALAGIGLMGLRRRR